MPCVFSSRHCPRGRGAKLGGPLAGGDPFLVLSGCLSAWCDAQSPWRCGASAWADGLWVAGVDGLCAAHMKIVRPSPGGEAEEKREEGMVALRWLARPKAGSPRHRQLSCALRAGRWNGEPAQVFKARPVEQGARSHSLAGASGSLLDSAGDEDSFGVRCSIRSRPGVSSVAAATSSTPGYERARLRREETERLGRDCGATITRGAEHWSPERDQWHPIHRQVDYFKDGMSMTKRAG